MNLNNIDISKLPADVRKQYKKLQVMHAEKQIQNKAKDDFMSFVKCVWPDFIEGSHHRHIAKKFNQLATGEITRLIVNMPPRHTKSEFASYLLPAWMVGRNPKLKIIQATHTGELAVRFGRKAKNLIDSEDYSKIFKTTLQEDSKAAGRWETAQGLSLIHISEPTRLGMISYAVFCLKKKYRIRLKMTSYPLLNVCGPILLKALTIDT